LHYVHAGYKQHTKNNPHNLRTAISEPAVRRPPGAAEGPDFHADAAAAATAGYIK
jgi:hypothetical protein